MIQIQGYEIPNKIEELSIAQFDKLFVIDANEELDTIEKWTSKFIYLGVPESAFDNMELNDFVAYVKEFNNLEMSIPERTTQVKVQNYTYSAPESISVKDFGLIEKVWRNQAPDRCLQTMAILFKRDDLNKAEHYAPAHLKQKAKLFSDIKASVIVPYMTEILAKLNNLTERKLDESTEELERSNG